MPSGVHRFLISSPDLRIDACFSLFTPSNVHRFLISSPDLRIDACFCLFTLSSAHRFLISRPDLRIDASFSPFPPYFVHRFLISGPDLRIDAAPSLLQLRTARLQRSRRVQAGTGCHEGGIILSKKPPEWRPVPAAARGHPRAQSSRRFPWSASCPIIPPLPVVSLGPILPPQWYPASIPVGENCATPQRFLPLHYRCSARWSGTAEVPEGSEVPEAPEAPEGTAEVPEAPEAPEVPDGTAEGSEKSEGIG